MLSAVRCPDCYDPFPSVGPQINVTHSALDVVLRASRDLRDWRDYSAMDRPREEIGSSPRREASFAWRTPTPAGDSLGGASVQQR